MDMGAALAMGVTGLAMGILALFKTKARKKLDADTAELERKIAALDAKAAKEKPIAEQDGPQGDSQEGRNMPLPPDVEEAKARMEKADAPLRADIESNAPVDREKRIELIDELQMAADDYVEKISSIRGWNYSVRERRT